MRRSRIIPLALTCLSACGPQADVDTARSEDSRAIINGQDCGRDEFPSAVAILVDGELSVMGFGTVPLHTVICTGTVIAPDVVMAAAHCVDEKTLTSGFGTLTRAQFYVTGEPNLAALADQSQMNVPFPDDAIAVREFVKNADFNVDNFNQNVSGPGDYHDISLLFLERAAPIAPMHVIAESEVPALVVSAEVDIAGWGQQAQGSGNPFEPPPAGSVGIKKCAHTTIGELGEKEMQVGPTAMSGRKCHGDSGGPTYLAVAGGMRVVGVTSHAYDNTDCAEKGGVDTRVDVWRAWLDEQMRSRCTAGTRAWCDEPGLPPADYTFPVIVDENSDGGVEEPDAGVTEEADAGVVTTENDAGTQQPQGSGGDEPQQGAPRPPGCSHTDVTGSFPWLGALMLVVARLRKRA